MLPRSPTPKHSVPKQSSWKRQSVFQGYFILCYYIMLYDVLLYYIVSYHIIILHIMLSYFIWYNLYMCLISYYKIRCCMICSYCLLRFTWQYHRTYAVIDNTLTRCDWAHSWKVADEASFKVVDAIASDVKVLSNVVVVVVVQTT